MILDSFSLAGKRALVTGCSTGLGQGMLLGLAEAGADVAGVDYVPADETAKMVADIGRKFVNIRADMSTLEPIDRIIEETVSGLGGIDILVNNAGIIRRNDSIDYTEKEWDDVININLKALFFLSQAVARQMVKQGTGGRIVSVASMLSFQGGIRVPAYTASKHGVAGITKILANEWSTLGINANAIAPGYMNTNNTAQLRADKERSAEILGRIPAGRWGLPADLKGAVVFLSSEASSYVTGQVLAVDGGWLAR